LLTYQLDDVVLLVEDGTNRCIYSYRDPKNTAWESDLLAILPKNWAAKFKRLIERNNLMIVTIYSPFLQRRYDKLLIVPKAPGKEEVIP
jgi:hypothetical protein